MNKRGQFYLLGAIVIITVIIGFVTISNYAKSETSTQLYDVKDELGIESGRVIEYGSTSNKDTITIIEGGESKTIPITEHFIDQYETYAGEDKEIYFIYGDTTKITLLTYDIKTSDVSIVGGESKPSQEVFNEVIIKEAKTPKYSEKEGVYKIEIKIQENVYDFELKLGENFYFILSQQIGDEQIVVVSEE